MQCQRSEMVPIGGEPLGDLAGPAKAIRDD